MMEIFVKGCAEIFIRLHYFTNNTGFILGVTRLKSMIISFVFDTHLAPDSYHHTTSQIQAKQGRGQTQRTVISGNYKSVLRRSPAAVGIHNNENTSLRGTRA